MKKFFNFNLSGSKLFPYYIIVYLFAILYFAAAANLGEGFSAGNNPSLSSIICLYGVFFSCVIVSIIVEFFINKLYLTNISFNDENLVFDGTLSEYAKINVKGFLLSIVTFGVYSSWFQENICRFYASNTSYGNKKFKFNGNGLTLFIISIAFFFAILIIVFTFALMEFFTSGSEPISAIAMYGLILGYVLVIGAFIYFVTWWSINFSYDNNTIKIKEGVMMSGTLIFLRETFFTAITLGIYYPAAIVKMYRFIIENTEARDENGVLVAEFGVNINALENFGFIFAQLLLSIITLGIYTPWAICKIYSTMINKSFMLLKE